MKIIVDTVKEDIEKLRSEDVTVVWGESNDTGKNNSKEALRHVCNFVKNNQTVNIVVIISPPRHDLLPSSCVNNEVINFNRHLKKRMAIYNNVKILDTDLERVHFTKHALHLNSSGKECIAQRLATVVRSFFNRKRISPICLQRKDDAKILNQDRTNNDSYVTNCNEVTVLQSLPPNSQTVTNNNEEKITHPQIVKRQRRNPALRDQDFFMDNIRSALTASQSLKDNEPVILTNTLNFCNETDCVMNFNE